MRKGEIVVEIWNHTSGLRRSSTGLIWRLITDMLKMIRLERWVIRCRWNIEGNRMRIILVLVEGGSRSLGGLQTRPTEFLVFKVFEGEY